MKHNFHFNHLKIEKFWILQWEKWKTHKFNPLSNKKPFYALDMFPYPSGSGLHVGHPRGYTAVDIIARMKRLQGYEVCHPIGWDAFGLPAEQYAIKHNIHPQIAIKKNINTFRNQLKKIGFCYDYALEINTSDSDILEETQRMFQRFLNKKIAKKAFRKNNWCEHLKTVLAKEETYAFDGKVFSKIGDHPVTQRYQKQWVIQLSKYADSLLEGLKTLDWPAGIVKQQQQWIGRRFVFQYNWLIKNIRLKIIFETGQTELFAYGLLLSADSPIFSALVLEKDSERLINQIKEKSDLQRSVEAGILIDTMQSFEFQGHLIKLWCWSKYTTNHKSQGFWLTQKSQCYENSSDLIKNKPVKLRLPNDAFQTTIYKIQDWVFSRQRFWGEPFPVFYNEGGEMFLDKQLPVKLPDTNVNFTKIAQGVYPLKKCLNWYKFRQNSTLFIRDPNVMPQWAASCWYYIAYLWRAAKNLYGDQVKLRDKRTIAIINKFLPVNLYIGGREHAVLHLIYARFWHFVLQEIGIVKCPEPFQKLVCQGLILGKNNQKMSKSRNNVVNPDGIINKYGADALRCYEMFIGPLEKDFKWEDNLLLSVRRWLDRFSKMYELAFATPQRVLTPSEHNAYVNIITKIESDLESYSFNTAISQVMIFTNICYKNNIYPRSFLRDILVIFSCICPFICEDLYHSFYKAKPQWSIYFEKWPQPKLDSTCQAQPINIVVQQHHRTRFIFNYQISDNMSKSDLLAVVYAAAKKHPSYIAKLEIYTTLTPSLHISKEQLILNFK